MLIDFLLEATFGVAFDTVTGGFASYRDLSAVKGMTSAQKEAFLQTMMLVMMADGGLSEEEKVALQGKLRRLRVSDDVRDRVVRIERETGEALLHGQGSTLLSTLLAAMPEKSHRQAVVNVAWEVHRIDDHHVEEKMVLLHQLCQETGVFPSEIKE